MPISLQKITQQCFAPTHIVAFDNSLQGITYQQFLHDIANLTKNLSQHSAQQWALYHESAYAFAVGFFALLHAQKSIIIPGNITPQTLSSLNSICDGFLGEFPNADLAIQLNAVNITSAITLPAIQDQAALITIFTSGSSGEPKAIPKALAQFNAEIEALETCFGVQIQSANIITTVSHQHIYGLLFSILWPISCGRAFFNNRPLDPALVIKQIAHHPNTTIWIASPAHLKRLHQQLDWLQVQHKLLAIFSSGGPLPEIAAQQLSTWYGKSAIEVYGSSETGGIAWRMQNSEQAHWKALPKVTLKIDQEQRLLIQSAHLANNDWYATDDSAKLLEKDTFQLLGRLDRTVKLEEKRLSLVEMEHSLNQHAFIQESHCRVVHSSQKLRDELVAIIALNNEGLKSLNAEGKALLTQQLKTYLSHTFELSLLPRKWRYVEQIPTNLQSKIDHHAILGLLNHND